MTIKALRTRYNGIEFRSRLEAKWAVYFDLMGIAYRYEGEDFTLKTANGNVVRYLPDFWLPGLRTFVEVKGEMGDADAIKVTAFRKEHDLRVVGPMEEYAERFKDRLDARHRVALNMAAHARFEFGDYPNIEEMRRELDEIVKTLEENGDVIGY